MNKKKRNFRSHWHCVYHLHYHLVLVTKYRKQCLNKSILQELENICANLLSKWDIKLLEFGGESDHIHMLIAMHPNIMPSKLVNSLKTVTSRLIRKNNKEYLKKFYWKPQLWTRAYCLVSAGGASLEVLTKYIEKQQFIST